MGERKKTIVFSTPPSVLESLVFLTDLVLSLYRPKVGKKPLGQLSHSLAFAVGEGPGPLLRNPVVHTTHGFPL